MKPSVASLYQAIELAQDIRPLLIGERCNANGSKKFRDLLLVEDDAGCLKIAVEQEAAGAHVLDLCTAYAGRDEKADLVRLVRLFSRSVKLPLMIDSTTPDCIETCLRLVPGRCIVNSINLEDGGRNLDRVCRLVKKFGAAVVALTINEKGMALSAEEKVATARRIRDLAVDRYGLRPTDLLFDALTFTVGSGDESLRDAAIQTLEAIRRIKAELPGVFTVLGGQQYFLWPAPPGAPRAQFRFPARGDRGRPGRRDHRRRQGPAAGLHLRRRSPGLPGPFIRPHPRPPRKTADAFYPSFRKKKAPPRRPRKRTTKGRSKGPWPARSCAATRMGSKTCFRS